MSQIDWSKAPEATHWYPTNESFYRIGPTGVQKLLINGKWVESLFDCIPKACFERPVAEEFVPFDFSGTVIDFGSLPSLVLGLIDAYQGEADHAHYRVDLVDALRAQVKKLVAVQAAPEWDGQGLPPVGIDCERSFSHSTWKATTICGHSTDGAYAAFYDGDGLMGWADNCKFRPLRTPEQIIADREREERIKAAQLWLEGISQEYGRDAADKCEDILMEAEERRKVAQ